MGYLVRQEQRARNEDKRPEMSRLIHPLAGLLLGACSSNAVGPCDVRYEDPLLTIAQVADSRTGALLPQVLVRDVRFNGTGLGDLRMLAEPWPGRGVAATGSDLQCTVACGFGTQEGVYEMTIHRPAYRDTTLTIDARYQSSRGAGECRVVVSGGVRLHLRLTPF